MIEKETLMGQFQRAAVIPDTSRQFELELTEVVKHSFDLEAANAILEDCLQNLSGTQLQTAYAAFYCINIYHRTHLNKDKLQHVWTKYYQYFKVFSSLKHLDILHFLMMLDDCHNIKVQEQYLEEAFKQAWEYPDNAGYQHAFADLFASVVEKNDSGSQEAMKDAWYEKALAAMNRAIDLDADYAKYYCTKGRLLSAAGAFEEADRHIRRAINKENSQRADYAVCIGNYQYYRLQNQAKEQLSAIQMKIDEEEDCIHRMKRSVTSNVEIVALFSCIVSFVLGALKLADGETAVHAGLLIFTLMGCLTAVFTAFILLLHLGDEERNNGPAFILIVSGIAVAAAATGFAGVL